MHLVQALEAIRYWHFARPAAQSLGDPGESGMQVHSQGS